MFSNASNYVHGVDNAFLIILGFSFITLIILTIIMIVFVVKYNKKKQIKAVQIKDNTMLEVTWTVIPIILALLMFYIGWEGFLPMRNNPKNAMRVKVTGKMWKWSFEYPGNKQSDTLVLPIHKAVYLALHSNDVIHGFFIPSFRVKEDVVPGMNNKYTWFIPGELGDYDLFCSSYCGVSHSYMLGIVRILPEDKFAKWLNDQPTIKQGGKNDGYKLMENNGCFACHATDGSKNIGPTFKGLYGSTVQVMTNGVNRKIKADNAYIKTSIYDPNADVVVGYQPGIMKSYRGIIKDKDLPKINEYLKTLK